VLEFINVSICGEYVMFNSYFSLVSCYFLFVYDFIINKEMRRILVTW